MNQLLPTIEELLKLEETVNQFTLRKGKRIKGLIAGKHASVLKGRGLEFMEVRKYVIGDDIRSIDWKVTARKGETHTKLYSEEKERPQLYIMDYNPYMFFGSTTNLKLNVGLKLLTLGALRAYHMGDSLSIYNVTTLEDSYFKPTKSIKNIKGYLEQSLRLANNLLSSQRQSTNKELILEKIQHIAKHDYIINFITDATQFNKKEIEIIKSIGRNNSFILSHIYDKFEKTLPNTRISLTDGNTQIDWKLNKNDVQNYQVSYDQNLKKIKQELLNSGVPSISLNTQDDFTNQINKILDEQRHR